jgi:transcriptional regulator with XRE-family HTH domain
MSAAGSDSFTSGRHADMKKIVEKINSYIGSEPNEQHQSSVPILAPGIGTRITAAADLLGTRVSAAMTMGVSVDSLQRYLRAERVPPLDVAAALCAATGVSLDWLAFDQGPMKALVSQTASGNHSQQAGVDEDVLEGAVKLLGKVMASRGVSHLEPRIYTRYLLDLYEVLNSEDTQGASDKVLDISDYVAKRK